MEDHFKPSTGEILKFNDQEFKDYIFNIQNYLQQQLEGGLSIDEILDTEDPFEALEPLLPEEVYPIMVLAMINNIKTYTVMEALTEGFQKGVINYMKANNE